MSYCECDYSDAEPVEFYRVETVRAKKTYRCDECGGPVYPTESYRRLVGKWGGSLDTIRTCHLCVELEQWATISAPCFCTMVGELHERAREMVSDVAPTVPGFFYEYGRRMVRIRQRQRAYKAARAESKP